MSVPSERPYDPSGSRQTTLALGGESKTPRSNRTHVTCLARAPRSSLGPQSISQPFLLSACGILGNRAEAGRAAQAGTPRYGGPEAQGTVRSVRSAGEGPAPTLRHGH